MELKILACLGFFGKIMPELVDAVFAVLLASVLGGLKRYCPNFLSFGATNGFLKRVNRKAKIDGGSSYPKLPKEIFKL